MKIVTWLVSIGVMFTFSATIAKGFTIDGVADAGYGSAISTQAIGTVGGDNTETNQGYNTGSELDAAYGVISNGVLYLVLAGNMDSDPVNGIFPNDELHLFFMTNPNGTDHTLGTNYPAYLGRINRMGVDGGSANTGGPGLTFDANFTPNYWIGINVGEPMPPNGTPPTMFADYQVVQSNGFSASLGSVVATNIPPNNVLLSGQNNGVAAGIQIAINTTNIAGVDGTPCTMNLLGQQQSVNAAAVRTGVELAIPLTALGNPTGQVSICTFITDQLCDEVYNQVLGPLNGGAGYCQGDLGDPSSLTFGAFPGQHYFTLTLPPCNAMFATPTSASFGPSGGTSNETVTLNGGGLCGWTASSGVPWITITPPSSGTSGGAFTYSVATNTSVTPRTGTLTIVGTSVSLTQTVSVAQSGSSLPPLGIVTVDGTVDTAYGCPLAVQQISTSYGKNTNTNIMGAGGSELDASYGLVQNNTLFLLLAGNIQSNGNHVMVFFMTGPDGQNTLTNVNPSVDNVSQSGITRSVLSWMGPTNSPPGPGLTFDPGFAPNYFMDVNCTVTQVFFNYAQLWPGGTNASGIATNGYFLGSNHGTNGTLVGGTNPFGIQATVNNSNTNGVDAANDRIGCYTNAEGVAGGEITQALTVSTGIELGIPLAALGSPTGTIAVCAFISNNTGLQLSNQILGPFGTNDPTFCMTGPGRVTNTPYVVLSSYPGQHYFHVGPEMRVSSILLSNTDVHVTYLTEDNTNMLYRLERTTAPLTLATTNNTVWIPVPPGYVSGTGGFINEVDTKAGTNKPSVFYRVRQTPVCTPP